MSTNTVKIDEQGFNHGVNEVLRMKPISQAFKRGFVRGFTSPFRVFNLRHKYPTPSTSDIQAWQDIGELLNKSYNAVEKEVVKNSIKDRTH